MSKIFVNDDRPTTTRVEFEDEKPAIVDCFCASYDPIDQDSKEFIDRGSFDQAIETLHFYAEKGRFSYPVARKAQLTLEKLKIQVRTYKP